MIKELFNAFFPSSLILVAFVIITLLWVIKLIVFKKFAFVELVSLIGISVLMIFVKESKLWLNILIVIFLYILVAHAIYTFITSYQRHIAYDKELNNFLKNNEFDFFVQTSSKDRIRDYSNTLLKITGLPRRELQGLPCWKLLFDNLKITKINKKELSLVTVGEFLNQYKEANGKHVIYQFEFEMPKIEDLTKDDIDTKNLDLVKYKGLIQPVYHKNKLIGRNIYFYQERMQVLNDLRSALKQACEDLENAQNFVYIVMSMTDYMGLYFDYNTRTYIATEAFVKFTRDHQKEYTFNQFMEMMHPDDVDNYIQQASTINSNTVTKIKFRLLINDDYYYVLEDSININKDNDLVSIIRILNKVDELGGNNTILSTKEAEQIIDQLSTYDVESLINKTDNILDTIIGNEDEKA